MCRTGALQLHPIAPIISTVVILVCICAVIWILCASLIVANWVYIRLHPIILRINKSVYMDYFHNRMVIGKRGY